MKTKTIDTSEFDWMIDDIDPVDETGFDNREPTEKEAEAFMRSMGLVK